MNNGRLHFLTWTFTESKLWSKYLLKVKKSSDFAEQKHGEWRLFTVLYVWIVSKSKQSGTKNKRRNGYTMT